jgi:hypothetical protein
MSEARPDQPGAEAGGGTMCTRGWRACVGGVHAWVACMRGWRACVGGVHAWVVCMRGWRACVGGVHVWVACMRGWRACVGGVHAWVVCMRGWCACVGGVHAWVACTRRIARMDSDAALLPARRRVSARPHSHARCAGPCSSPESHRRWGLPWRPRTVPTRPMTRCRLG